MQRLWTVLPRTVGLQASALHFPTICRFRAQPHLPTYVRGFAKDKKGKDVKGKEVGDKEGMVKAGGIGGAKFDEKALIKKMEGPMARCKDDLATIRIGRILPGAAFPAVCVTYHSLPY